MNQDNRVLVRKGARELTEPETDRVHGAIRTETKCSNFKGHLDGDVGEC